MALDEAGLTDEDFLRLFAYWLAKNRQKHRAGHYTRKHTVDSDLRNIVVSTGEDFLHIGRRLRGQDVRLMQFPACVSDYDDIFDADGASDIVGKTISQREKFVNALEESSRQFQGIALLEFVSRLVDDSDADKKLKTAVEEFISQSPIPSSRAFARIRRRIAVVYASMALAIDYDILPFGKQATLRDLRKCMNDAINLLITEAPISTAVGRSDDDLLSQFRRRLRSATFVRAGAYAQREKRLTAEQIESADGFIHFTRPNRYRVMLQTGSMRTWFPLGTERNRLVALLRQRKILSAGRQADTCSRQVKLKPYPNKISVYRLMLNESRLTLGDLQIR